MVILTTRMDQCAAGRKYNSENVGVYESSSREKCQNTAIIVKRDRRRRRTTKQDPKYDR